MDINIQISRRHAYMILFVLVLGFASVLVFSQSSPTQGHPASEITPGTFNGAGDYIFPPGSKVGIGTDNPQELLHVRSTDDTIHTPPWWFRDIALFETDEFVIKDSSPNLKLETTNHGGGPNLNFGLRSRSDDKLEIYSYSDGSGSSGYTNRLLIDGNNGNVGIGTDNPQELLHVQGTADAVHTPPWKFDDIALFETDELIIKDRSPELKLETTNFGGAPNLNFELISGSDDKLSIVSYSDGDLNKINRLVVNGNNGNVGIGKYNPSTKLDVDGVIRASPISSATCNANTEGGIYYDSDDNHFYGCNGNNWIQLDGGGGGGVVYQ